MQRFKVIGYPGAAEVETVVANSYEEAIEIVRARYSKKSKKKVASETVTPAQPAPTSNDEAPQKSGSK